MIPFDTLYLACADYFSLLNPGESLSTDITVQGVLLPVVFYKFDDLIIKSQEEVSNIFSSNLLDGPMQIIMANHLEIKEGVILTPKNRCKGLVLFVAGKLDLLGTVSMTARGCVAEGKDIFLYQERGQYEKVPAIGALGAPSITSWCWHSGYGGATGYVGKNRQTGGGGRGGGASWAGGNIQSSRGGNGTSFSGGPGGGKVMQWAGNWGRLSHAQVSGSDVGGKGGDTSISWDTQYDSSTGGVGNPGGKDNRHGDQNNSGTGGLLIIYANILNFQGFLESRGTDGRNAWTWSYKGQGGASGGGSINVFYSKFSGKELTANVRGGYGDGNGGAGTATFQQANMYRFLVSIDKEILID